MKYEKSLILDVNSQNKHQYINAKQCDDKSRFVNITLISNGEKITFNDGVIATFRALKPDGKSVEYEAILNNTDNTITVELTKQTLAVKGITKADVLLIDEDGSMLSSATFYIQVDEAPFGINEDSKNELLILQEAIKNANKSKEAIETALNNGDFNGNDGQDGADGAKGDKGDPGPQGPPGKDAITDSELDVSSNNAISNSAVSIAINEIVEQLKNGITDYWKLENSPFQPVPDAPNPPELLRVPQDLEAGAYIFKEDGVHFNLNGESMYSSAGGLLYVSYYRGNHKAVQYITATDIMFAVSSYDGVQTINMDFLRTQTEINEDIFSGIQQISNWFLPLFSVKAGQLVSVKSADAENLTLELEGVDYPQITTADNTENKQVTDTQICITDNIGKNIKSIACDSYPKQITVVRNNMATCDDFFRDMTNKQAKVIFTNHLDTKYNQDGVNWVYLDGLKTGSYIMSAKSNTEGQTVNKMVRMPTGAVVAPQSTLDEYTFTNNQERTGQIQVRFYPTAVGITATQVYMCKAEDKQIITVNSAEDVFENILGDKNTYLFAEDGSEITVVYETEKKDKPLKGKYLSVLGDSISSYEGYAKNADHIIYPNYDVFKPNRMYWGRFCEMTGAEPLVIDGVGSSTITNIRDSLGGDETFVGMYHDNRAKQLGKDGIVPDIIVVEGGTNDMALNANLGTYDGSTDFPTAANKFREAYTIMLDKIRTEYPKAEIYCSTIMARPNATDYTIKQYNDAIREIAELMGAKIIDFAKCLNVKNYQQFISSDNIHPEYDGHIRMCDEMIKAIL